MKEFRFVGNHPDELDGGRPIEPGEFTGPIDISEESPKNKQLSDDGLLLEVSDGTYKEEVGGEPPPARQVLRGDALQARADELDIEGRSKMNADELRAAIAEAEATDETGDGD